MKKIIDISKNNVVTDWGKVKTAVDGVIIRMGYRGYTKGKIVYDPLYESHRRGVIAYDIPHSFYFFPCSINDAEAIEEADFIINELQGVHIDFPVFLDSEISDVKNKSGRSDNLSVAQRTWLLKIICERVNAAGIPCGVYASTSWLKNNLNMGLLSMFPVWVAQYNTKCTYSGVYMMWQYTSKASIPGINGNVDCSYLLSEWDINLPKIDHELDEAITVIAKRVISGTFGTGHDRRKDVIYELVRQRVNSLC